MHTRLVDHSHDPIYRPMEDALTKTMQFAQKFDPLSTRICHEWMTFDP